MYIKWVACKGLFVSALAVIPDLQGTVILIDSIIAPDHRLLNLDVKQSREKEKRRKHEKINTEFD